LAEVTSSLATDNWSRVSRCHNNFETLGPRPLAGGVADP